MCSYVHDHVIPTYNHNFHTFIPQSCFYQTEVCFLCFSSYDITLLMNSLAKYLVIVGMSGRPFFPSRVRRALCRSFLFFTSVVVTILTLRLVIITGPVTRAGLRVGS